jgi:hypothetical protein
MEKFLPFKTYSKENTEITYLKNMHLVEELYLEELKDISNFVIRQSNK